MYILELLLHFFFPSSFSSYFHTQNFTLLEAIRAMNLTSIFLNWYKIQPTLRLCSLAVIENFWTCGTVVRLHGLCKNESILLGPKSHPDQACISVVNLLCVVVTVGECYVENDSRKLLNEFSSKQSNRTYHNIFRSFLFMYIFLCLLRWNLVTINRGLRMLAWENKCQHDGHTWPESMEIRLNQNLYNFSFSFKF